MSILTKEQRRAFESQQRGIIGEHEAALFFMRLVWTAQKLPTDEGEDLIIEVKDDFRSSGLKFQIQVKTPEKLTKVRKGYSYKIETQHLKRWENMNPPVFILLWEIGTDSGYWIAVADVIKELNKKPGWERKGQVSILFPLNNSTTQSGLLRLRRRAADLILPYVAQGKRLEANLTFTFPVTPEGKRENQEILEHLKTGEQISISGQHLSNITYSDWYERLHGPAVREVDHKVRFSIGPAQSHDWNQVRLTIIPDTNAKIAREHIEVRAVAIGQEQIRFSNAEKPTPFLFEMIARTSGQYNFRLSLKNSVCSANQLKEAFVFFDTLTMGGTLRIEMLQQYSGGKDWKKIETPFEKQLMSLSASYRQLVDDLAEIENATGVPFVLNDAGITQDEAAQIPGILNIIRKGERIYDFEHWDYTLEGFVPHSHIKSAIKGDSKFHGHQTARLWVETIVARKEANKPFYFDMTCDLELNLFGAVVPLGPLKMRLDANITQAGYERLKQGLERGEKFDPLVIELENGHVREVLTDWYREL